MTYANFSLGSVFKIFHWFSFSPSHQLRFQKLSMAMLKTFMRGDLSAVLPHESPMCSLHILIVLNIGFKQTLLNGTGRVVVVLNETKTDVCMYT